MLVSVNNVDITKFINPKTYSMNAEKIYKSWEDGNLREHRIYVRSKIAGSFEVALYGQDNTFTQDFLDIWNSAVSNNAVTILVYVQNENRMSAIEAYYEFEGTFHREMINGNYCDILKISITER